MSQCRVGRRGVEPVNLWHMSQGLTLRLGAGGGLGALLSGIDPWNQNPCRERDDTVKFISIINFLIFNFFQMCLLIFIFY